MRVYKVSEKEIDERPNLDKRKTSKAFCINFDSPEEILDGFYDLQNQIRDGLEKLLWTNFDDGVDRAHLQSWEPNAMHTLFHFDSDPVGSQRIMIEIDCKIVADKLVRLILAYLKECPSHYCAIVTVCKMASDRDVYVGRVIVNLDEIAVEESVASVWSKQVQYMEIES